MTTPDRRTERDPEATRRVLLDAAAEQFAAHGFAGCRTRRIADAAGANKAMISYHFGGKLGLYRAVIRDHLAGLRPRLQALRDGTGTAEKKWRCYLRELMHMFANRPALYRIILREHLDGGSRLQQEFAEDISEFFRTTRAILDQARREGSVGDLDPHAVHLSLVGAITFYLASIPFRQKAESEGRLIFPSPETGAYLSHLERLFTGLFVDTNHQLEKNQ